MSEFQMNPVTGELDLVNPSATGISASSIVHGETPTPATDGAQTVFAVANAYVAGSLKVYRGSLLMYNPTDFSETTSTTFTMVVAPDSDEPLRVDYIKA